MDTFRLRGTRDIQSICDLIQRLPESTVVDFEEAVLLESFQSTACLWWENDRLAGFAYVDEVNNLWFETDPDFPAEQLAPQIVTWGLECMRRKNAASGLRSTLDASCSASNSRRIALLERNGFAREKIRALRYARSLDEPIAKHGLPAGFSLRCVEGECEVDRLAALHRAAFGTDIMTVERRLAIMRAPNYEPEMDFVVIAPDGEMAAFCVCGFEEGQSQIGYTDPIGAHPRYQKLGLGRAVVTAGLLALQRRGAQKVTLGTSSENRAMQRLAEALGFKVEAENLWFFREVA